MTKSCCNIQPTHHWKYFRAHDKLCDVDVSAWSRTTWLGTLPIPLKPADCQLWSLGRPTVTDRHEGHVQSDGALWSSKWTENHQCVSTGGACVRVTGLYRPRWIGKLMNAKFGDWKKTPKKSQKIKNRRSAGPETLEKCRTCGFESSDVAARLICVSAKRA